MKEDHLKQKESSIEPLLRWAGSKRKLVPTLLHRAPESFKTYHEPFVGSAALFAAIAPDKSVLSDFNHDLIDFYKRIVARPWIIYEKTKAIEVSKRKYYEIRAINPTSLGKVDRAVRFFYLNRYCFNGVYRTNMQNNFNVPMGTKTGNFPTLESYANFVQLLKTADLKYVTIRWPLKQLKKTISYI